MESHRRAEASGGPAALAGAKRRDYWWTVLFTDPVALPLVRLLERRRWLSPDQVTALATFVGLAVGPAFALGTRGALVAGAILFQVSFVLDCVDGKLARALGRTGPRGAALDRISDGARRASATVGLLAWLWREGPVQDIWFGIAYAVAAYYFLELSGSEAPIEKTTRPVEAVAGTQTRGRWAGVLARRRLLPNPGMPDVQALVFVIGPLTGLVVGALVLGTVMVLAGILVSVYRRTR